MLGKAVGAGRHAFGSAASAARGSSRLANIGTNNAHRVVNGECQRNWAPLPIFVENELGACRSAAGKRCEQLESPMVLVGTKHLPAALVLVPMAPDPIAAAELGGELSCGLVQCDNGSPFRGRVTHRMPDGLRWFAGVRCVGLCRVEVEDRTTTDHLGPAVGLGRVGSWVARSPCSAEFEDRQAWPVTQPHDCPFHTEARFFPEDPGGAEGNRTK